MTFSVCILFLSTSTKNPESKIFSLHRHMDSERDEPLTPAGRLFLRPEVNQVILCALGGKDPIDLETVRSAISSSLMTKHPRFCSVILRDGCGREHWRRTEVDVDRHLVIRRERVGGDCLDDDAAVNEYMADLAVSSPLDTAKPLWEVHVLVAHRSAVLRVHHALGDGISLMSMLLTACRRADDPTRMPAVKALVSGSGSGRNNCWTVVGKLVRMVVFTVVFVLEFIVRCLWVKDKRTALSGGDEVELWPRKLATARFGIADLKTVKRAVAHATINDVLMGIISSGLSRYLDSRTPKALQEGSQLTGVAMVNLRPQPGLQDMSKLMESKSEMRFGNKLGFVLLPVNYHRSDSDPLTHVKRAKAMIDRKKMSLEAHFSYNIGLLVMSYLGPKFAALLNYRILCNTTFTFSNVVGPGEEITMAGNPIDYMRVSSTSLPHALTMHTVSYAGNADMQILVAKDIIPDPEVLAKCFEDALLDMKDAAEAATKN